MEPNRFDTLSRALAAHGPRRGVLGLLATVPIVGGLLGILSSEEIEAAGRRKRRKTRHKRRSGSDKKNRKGKHKKKKQPTCTPTTCVAQGKSCGRPSDGCGTTLDCGPCTCAIGCSNCQTCNPATGLCDDVTNDTACDDGDACTQTDTCQNGTCVGSNPVVCATGQACVAGSCACTAASCPGGCCDGTTCLPGNTNASCGTGGTACNVCTIPRSCLNGACACPSSCPAKFVQQADCTCVCPADGYELVNGGCFQIASGACDGCGSGCGCATRIFGSSNTLCVFGTSVLCPNNVCATGTACNNGSSCAVPC